VQRNSGRGREIQVEFKSHELKISSPRRKSGLPFSSFLQEALHMQPSTAGGETDEVATAGGAWAAGEIPLLSAIFCERIRLGKRAKTQGAREGLGLTRMRERVRLEIYINTGIMYSIENRLWWKPPCMFAFQLMSGALQRAAG